MAELTLTYARAQHRFEVLGTALDGRFSLVIGGPGDAGAQAAPAQQRVADVVRICECLQDMPTACTDPHSRHAAL
eukprot:5062786-Lingulodinium_polyedra.AAC.1